MIRILEETIATIVGSGSMVEITSVNGVGPEEFASVGNETRRLVEDGEEEDGVVFDVTVALPCHTLTCDDAAADAAAAAVSTGEQLAATTSSECEICFDDYMREAALIVAAKMAHEFSMSVDDVLKMDALETITATLAAVEVTSDGVGAAEVGTAVEGSMLDALVEAEAPPECGQCVGNDDYNFCEGLITGVEEDGSYIMSEGETCRDENARLTLESGGDMRKCAVYASNCENDDGLVELGAKRGWFRCLCRLTCGMCEVPSTDSPTIAPTAEPTFVPTEAPNSDVIDGSGMRVGGGGVLTALIVLVFSMFMW
jgi:hypothetical protein